MAKNVVFNQPLDQPIKTADRPLREAGAPGDGIHALESQPASHPLRKAKGDLGGATGPVGPMTSTDIVAGLAPNSKDPALTRAKRTTQSTGPFSNVKGGK